MSAAGAFSRTPPGGEGSGGRRPTTSLLADLAREISLLIRQELALAKSEVDEKLDSLGYGLALLGAGALVAFCGLIYVLGSAVLALAIVLPAWAAALIVGAVVLTLGISLLFAGKRHLSAARRLPSRTLRSLQNDAAWVRDQVSP